MAKDGYIIKCTYKGVHLRGTGAEVLTALASIVTSISKAMNEAGAEDPSIFIEKAVEIGLKEGGFADEGDDK